MALEGEIGGIDLQQEAVPHDRLVLDLEGGAERGEIGPERVVVLVAHGHGDDAGRRRTHERLGEGGAILVEHGFEVIAFVVDHAGIEVAHLADRLRQSAEGRHLSLGGVVLGPHALEFGIAVDVGARRALPAPAETGEPALEIEEEGIALLLAVVADVDPDLALFRTMPRTASRPARSISAASTASPRERSE